MILSNIFQLYYETMELNYITNLRPINKRNKKKTKKTQNQIYRQSRITILTSIQKEKHSPSVMSLYLQ